jgi:hypothetical protein
MENGSSIQEGEGKIKQKFELIIDCSYDILTKETSKF